MRTVILCLLLCACGDAPATESVVVAREKPQPIDNGQIQNPTKGGGGCGSVVVMFEGQLFEVPQACNEGLMFDKGDPFQDKGDPARIFLKSKEQ